MDQWAEWVYFTWTDQEIICEDDQSGVVLNACGIDLIDDTTCSWHDMVAFQG